MPKVYLSPAMHRQNECCYPRPDGKQCYEALENNEYIDILEPVLNRCGIETKRGYRRTPMNNEDGDKIMKQNVAESNAWGADVHYISHTNGANGTVKGYRPIYFTGSAKGKKLAEIMVKYRKQIYPYSVVLNNRTDLYELKNTNAVAFYEEHVFHDNLEDATWFHTHMNEIAESAAKGLCEYFGIPYIAPAATSSTPTMTTTILRKGSTGPEVKSLQKKLLQIGYYLGSYGADGDYGENTELAVRLLQKDSNLTVDGVFGKQTSESLDLAVSNAAAANKAIVNKIKLIKTPPKCTKDLVIKYAKQELGNLEKDSLKDLNSKTSNAGDNNYTKYAQEADAIGLYNALVQGQPWCATWVDNVFIHAYGLNKGCAMKYMPTTKSKSAACNEAAAYYQKVNKWFDTPEIGDQVFFKSAKYNYAHTGLVIDIKDNKVITIEGNTSSKAGVVENGGAVEQKEYPLNYSNFKGFGRPDYDEEIQEQEPIEDKSYVVRITAVALNVRSGPGTNYPVVKVLREGGNSFTIVDEKNGFGLLKSGIGWIMLQHTERVI